MKKLFEIPVYALSPTKLNLQVNKRIGKLKKLLACSSSENIARVIDIETIPMRNWDYNHIIGYIRITASKTDIIFDVYMPLPFPKRYVWSTTRKFYVENICSNGTRIYMGNFKTNEDIRNSVSNMLEQVIADHIPLRYHVDREAFDTINENLDYLTMFQNG